MPEREPAPWPFRPWALVERGGMTESAHEGILAVVDDTFAVRARWGDPSLATFPRSSAKPFQAIPLVASGAADALGLTPAQVAVCCASHSGEPFHVDAVRDVLARAGVDESLLHCGAHAPLHGESARELVRRREKPGRIHNNCSGKHAGMIAASARRGFEVATYWRPEHPLQREIAGVLAALAGLDAAAIRSGIDGCGVPAWNMPLDRFALAAARFVSGRGPAAPWAPATARLFDAMTRHPEMVAGTRRFDTELMQATRRPVLSKGGAEGFHLAAWREADGTGVALCAKAASGDDRSRDFVVTEALYRLGLLDDTGLERLASYHRAPMKNHAGDDVGRMVSLFSL